MNEQLYNQTQLLDNFEKNAGLPACNPPGDESELSHYLNMNRDELRALSLQDTGEIAYRLGQYALFLQRTINRQTERLNWLNNEITKITCSRVGQFSNGSWEDRKMLAINENDVAKKYKELAVSCQSRIDRLNYLSRCVQNLSELMRNLGFTKRSQNE